MAFTAICARAQVADVLSYIESTAEAESKASVPDVSSDKAWSDPIGVLDFVENACGEAGYHSSGVLPGACVGSILQDISRSCVGMKSKEWGRVTSGFGYRPSFGRMHYGVDFAMAVGDTVRVPVAGRIDRIGYDKGGYGHFIVLKHDDGMETRYAHLSSVMVKAGDYVAKGHPVALSGNSGNSTGPHLHFEVRFLGMAVDPLTVFDFTQNDLRLSVRKR